MNVFHLHIVPNIAHNPKQKTLIEKHNKTLIAKYFLKGSLINNKVIPAKKQIVISNLIVL